MRAVCYTLDVSRSHVVAKRNRPPKWTDLEKSPPSSDDAVVKQVIANVAKGRATYGYRLVWARLRLEGYDQVNHKRGLPAIQTMARVNSLQSRVRHSRKKIKAMYVL